MNDVSGSGSGTGLRGPQGKTSRTSDANFEDDSEWDVGIGNLIIDLDADIAEAAKNDNEASRSVHSGATNNSVANSASNSPIHSPVLTPPTPTTQQQMHIPPPSSGPSSGNTSTTTTPTPSSNPSSSSSKTTKNASSSNTSSKQAGAGESSGNSMEISAAVESNKGLKMKIKRTKTGTKSGADEKHEIVKTELSTASSGGASSINPTSGGNSVTSTASKNSGLNDSISSKSAHSSSHKDKDKIKDGSLIMIDADSIVGGLSNHGGTTRNTNNGINKDSNLPPTSSSGATSFPGNGEQGSGGKTGKTPRKGKETHNKKTKNNGVATKKESNSTSSNSESHKNNSISSHGGTTTSGQGSKDGKDYFNTATTVSLNVPTIVPNSSSAFSKTTLKVPNSITRINLEPHAVAAALDSTARNHNNSLANNALSSTSWNSGSVRTEKGLNSTSHSLSTEFKQENGSPSYGKKAKGLGGDKDKVFMKR